MPSLLAALMREHVTTALVARMRVAAEAEGEALAREALADPEFRADFLALARRIAREALERLGEPPPPADEGA